MVYSFPERPTNQELQLHIRKAEENFENGLLQIANQLAATSGLRLIGLTGPTCSGKTTAAKMLTAYLTGRGHSVHIISIDDFFYEKKYLIELSRKSGTQLLDYDSERTIDTGLLQACVTKLLCGKTVQLPHFNFLSGLRECGISLSPQKNDLFLFEGIQVLYPQISAIFNGEYYQCVAVNPSSSIQIGSVEFLPNDIRLMRRLVRDSIYRGADFSFTLSLWKTVRTNEENNIFPYLQNCNFTVDSTMPYEISVLKPYLQSGLSQIPPNDPSFTIAGTLMQAICNVAPVDSALISPNSLYREFI